MRLGVLSSVRPLTLLTHPRPSKPTTSANSTGPYGEIGASVVKMALSTTADTSGPWLRGPNRACNEARLHSQLTRIHAGSQITCMSIEPRLHARQRTRAFAAKLFRIEENVCWVCLLKRLHKNICICSELDICHCPRKPELSKWLWPPNTECCIRCLWMWSTARGKDTSSAQVLCKVGGWSH